MVKKPEELRTRRRAAWISLSPMLGSRCVAVTTRVSGSKAPTHDGEITPWIADVTREPRGATPLRPKLLQPAVNELARWLALGDQLAVGSVYLEIGN